MSEPLVKSEVEVKDLSQMTEEEYQNWIEQHHPDHMGFNGREGVDDDEFTE